jgi:hypothetical protein
VTDENKKHPTRRIGRPTKYKKRYCRDIIEFFDVAAVVERTKTITTKNGSVIEEPVYLPCILPTVVGFARKLGVCRDTLHEWASKHKDFSDAFKRAKELQEEIWSQNSLQGLYNPRFSEFFGINIMGWNKREIIEQHHSGEVKHTHDLSDDLKTVLSDVYDTQTGS